MRVWVVLFGLFVLLHAQDLGSYHVLKSVALEKIPFELMMVQDEKTGLRYVLLGNAQAQLWFQPKSMRLNDVDTDRIVEWQHDAQVYNFVKNHSKQLQVFVHSIPRENRVTLMPKHPTREFYYIVQGSVPKEGIEQVKKLLESGATVHVIFLGQLPFETGDTEISLVAQACLNLGNQMHDMLEKLHALEKCTPDQYLEYLHDLHTDTIDANTRAFIDDATGMLEARPWHFLNFFYPNLH